jgi:hypothetical protein
VEAAVLEQPLAITPDFDKPRIVFASERPIK